MATATALPPTSPRSLFFATSPLYLDPLLAQFNYISHEGVSGVAGPRIPNEHTLARGEYALTTSRYPQRRKKVAFDDVITTNRGEAYQMVPQAPPSPSSDGSLDSAGSGSSASSGSSRSTADGQASSGAQEVKTGVTRMRTLGTVDKGKAKI